MKTFKEKAEIPAKTKWRFSDILKDQTVKERWEKVKKFFFLRESTYDISNRCNIRCEGCYYYEGDKQFAMENRNPDEWRSFIKSEIQRGITYAVLAGAEPSLAPEILKVCSEEIPLGCIATNGFIKIPDSIKYKIHVSVWGNDTTSLSVRNAKNLLLRQIDNYRNDPRVVFVYTFTKENIDEASEVMDILAYNNCKVTFNIFSAPINYKGALRHDKGSLMAVQKMMIHLLDRFPSHVLFSFYNIASHTHNLGLHDLFQCSYPRMNRSGAIGLGRSFRQYRTDLSWKRDAACCVPDTDCSDCRHYASGSAIVTSRLYRHADNPEKFKSWLDYVDTYLSVWVMDYPKGANLCNYLVAPPGQG